MFPALEAKIIGVVILLALIGAAIFMYERNANEVATLKQTNAEEVAANKVQNQTIKNDQTVATINDKVDTNLSTAVADVNQEHDDVVVDTINKAHQIDKSFTQNTSTQTAVTSGSSEVVPGDLIETPTPTQVEQTEISTVYIDGLWKQYCANMSNTLQCKAYQTDTIKEPQ